MKISFKLLLILIGFTAFTGCDKEDVPKVPPVANAGASLTIQLPTSTVSVTGTGTTTNGSITGYLWTLVSGPNVPVITSPSSAATNINSLVAGTYIFRLQVTDNAGLSGTDTMQVKVNAALQQTLTLQPANNPYEGYYDILYLNSWFSTNIEIPIGAWTAGGAPETYRECIKFDFSSIYAGATIDDAKLYLYAIPTPLGGNTVDAHFGNANACYVQRITSPWPASATPFTWNSQPTVTTVNQAIIPQSTSSFQNDVIDVTALVRDMMTNGNNGFQFKMQSEVYYNIRQYVSSRHSDATKRPKLVITYR